MVIAEIQPVPISAVNHADKPKLVKRWFHIIGDHFAVFYSDIAPHPYAKNGPVTRLAIEQRSAFHPNRFLHLQVSQQGGGDIQVFAHPIGWIAGTGRQESG